MEYWFYCHSYHFPTQSVSSMQAEIERVLSLTIDEQMEEAYGSYCNKSERKDQFDFLRFNAIRYRATYVGDSYQSSKLVVMAELNDEDAVMYRLRFNKNSVTDIGALSLFDHYRTRILGYADSHRDLIKVDQ